jgi:hypothetical protein
MSITDDRATARLGPVVFNFEHPILDKTTAGRKVEHEVLPTGEDDDGETVVQPLGSGKTTLTLSGSVLRREAIELDGLEGSVVELRHPRHSGDVFVVGISTSSQQAVNEDGRLYVYDADLIAVGD